MKDLYIIVSSYPYVHGEAFLEEALPTFSKHFRKIFFVIPEASLISLERKRYTPPNSEIILIDSRIEWTSLIYFFITFPFRKDFWKELTYIKRSYKLPLSLGIFKRMVAFIVKSISFKKRFQPYISQSDHEIVLYTYWCTEFTFACCELKKQFPALKVVTSIHGWDAYFERDTLNYLPMRTAVFTGLDKIFTISDHGKKYLINKVPDFDVQKLETHYLGTKKGEYIAYDDREKEFRILSAAIMQPIKRIDRIPTALSHIRDIKIKWVHVGYGTNLEMVQSLANDLLNRNANISYEFKGLLGKDEIYNLMRDGHFHCILNTSESEGLPVSIMEAFSFGIPAIAPNVGGVPEMVHQDRNGVLMSSASTSEDIVNAIRQINGLSAQDFLRYRKDALDVWQQNFDSAVNFVETAISLNNL